MIRKISGFDKFSGLKANALISAKYKNFSKNTAPAPPPCGRQQSRRSQLHKTSKVTQTAMFRTMMRFNRLSSNYFFKSFKNHLHIYWLNSLGSVNLFPHKHACLSNFTEIKGTENSGSAAALASHAGPRRGTIRIATIHLVSPLIC